MFHLIAWTWGGDGQGGPSGTGYLITSGPLSASAAVGAAVVFIWSHLCTERGCWRPARRKDRQGHLLCFKHWQLSLPKGSAEAIPDIRASWEALVAERNERL